MDEEDRWQRSKKAAQMYASGIPPADIADTLKVTSETVEKDLTRFYRRYLDFQLIDGTVLGALLYQIDNLIGLALSGYSRAMQTVMGPQGQTAPVPDHYARRQYLATALDAIKEKSAILGFKRNESSPILQIIQAQSGEVNTYTASGIAPENVPAVRDLMRKMRGLMNQETVRTVADVERGMLIRGVKEPPYDHELPGVLIQKEEESPSGDGRTTSAF